METMSIEFTQYLMPDGRKSPQFIDRPEEVEGKAKAVVEAGGWFEMEMLNVPSGLPNVSITCAYQGDDLVMELAVNGPPVVKAVDAVVEEAYKILVKNPAGTS
jgi:hypothetical protein